MPSLEGLCGLLHGCHPLMVRRWHFGGRSPFSWGVTCRGPARAGVFSSALVRCQARVTKPSRECWPGTCRCGLLRGDCPLSEWAVGLSAEASPHHHAQGETGDNPSQVCDRNDVEKARSHKQGQAQQGCGEQAADHRTTFTTLLMPLSTARRTFFASSGCRPARYSLLNTIWARRQ